MNLRNFVFLLCACAFQLGCTSEEGSLSSDFRDALNQVSVGRGDYMIPSTPTLGKVVYTLPVSCKHLMEHDEAICFLKKKENFTTPMARNLASVCIYVLSNKGVIIGESESSVQYLVSGNQPVPGIGHLNETTHGRLNQTD